MRYLMKKSFNARKIACLSFFMLIPAAAYAYVDAGSGSCCLQAMLGIVLGAVFAVKLYWRKILALFAAMLKKDNG
jgi:hypothetical protein